VIEGDGNGRRGEERRGVLEGIEHKDAAENGRRLEEEKDTLGRQDDEDAVRQQPTPRSDEMVSLRQDLRDPNGMRIQSIRAAEITGDDWT
jgi:hypothetical protein